MATETNQSPTRPHLAYTELSEFTIVNNSDGSMHVEIAPHAVTSFINLVRRGTNTWDSAPQHIKQLVDVLTGVPTKK